MTRNEVVKILGDNNLPPTFADVLVALKLIKFDEEKMVLPVASIMALHLGNYPYPHNKADEILAHLVNYGYKIVRKID